MANYVLNPIEMTKYEVISQQDGKHYLRLHFNDLARSFSSGSDGVTEWFKKLSEADLIDRRESDNHRLETHAMLASELKKTLQVLLGRISAGNRLIEAENARREEERQDLLLAIGAMMGDIPREEEE